MTASTSVKWAVSSMVGAPTLNGTAGSLIAVLDAFLVNGFGTKAVDSATVTDGICRMNITGGSAAQDHCVIQLVGVTGDGVALNGPQRVKAATASYVEFPCDLPDGPLTGSITFKIASLGWEKVFSKTNVAVYRSTDFAGTRAYYRVDDTNALYARVVMYEAMSDVDTGVAPGPTTANLAGGYYWQKRLAAGSIGVNWSLVGDSRGFYISVAPATTTSAATINDAGCVTHFAGDIASDRSADAWCAALTGAASNSTNTTSGDVGYSSGNSGFSLARQSHGVGGAVQVARRTAGGNAYSGADATLGAFPSQASNFLHLQPFVLGDATDFSPRGPRGRLPGLFHVPQTGLADAFASDTQVLSGLDASGQVLLMRACGPANGASVGRLLWSLAPWRSA